jgi:hypothetical protein
LKFGHFKMHKFMLQIFVTTFFVVIFTTLMLSVWKGINRKQSTMWQHLSQLKASAFFSLQKNFSCYKTQQLILGTGIAIWWLTEPHCYKKGLEY